MSIVFQSVLILLLIIFLQWVHNDLKLFNKTNVKRQDTIFCNQVIVFKLVKIYGNLVNVNEQSILMKIQYYLTVV